MCLCTQPLRLLLVCINYRQAYLLWMEEWLFRVDQQSSVCLQVSLTTMVTSAGHPMVSEYQHYRLVVYCLHHIPVCMYMQ